MRPDNGGVIIIAMSKPSNFKIRPELTIPDDATVISAEDAQVFINRFARITVTMDFLFGEYQNQKNRGDTDAGVISGNIRFINGLAHEVDMYHVEGERIGSFSWLSTDHQYFLGAAMELGDEYYEAKYVVDMPKPIEAYTLALKTQERYPLEELFGELMEFHADYNMEAVLK